VSLSETSDRARRAASSVVGGLRFARSLSRGLRRGDAFPAAGRIAVAQAPGGSSELPPQGSLLERLRSERTWFGTSSHAVPVAGLPGPIDLLHLTDVHLKGVEAWQEPLCSALRAERPDLVLLTGDIVTRGWTTEAVQRFLAALPDAPLGRYAIMGNWEYWADALPDSWRLLLGQHGVELLVDEWRDLGPLVLAGTDDQLAGSPDPVALRHALPCGRPTVVMTHSPALFPELVAPDVALVLAGHSHAGQVRLPGLGAAWVPMGTGPFVAGWYQQEDTWLYVSRGLGCSIAPVRLYCPPELVRIRLEPATTY
jgi:uncharacterized protein